MEAERVVVYPRQMTDGPVMVNCAGGFTVIGVLGLEIHPVALSVNVNETVPAVKPVAKPLLSIEATAGRFEDQVPPVAGKN